LNAEGTAEWRTDVPSCSLVDDGYTKEQIEATMLQACAQNLSNELITRFGLANIITERSRFSKHESTCLLPVAKVSTLAEPIRKYFRPCPNQFDASGKFRSSPGMQHAVQQGSSPSSTPLVRETVADRRPTSEQKAASPSRTNITAIAVSTPSTRAAHAADETPTDPCWIKIENIKSKDYFRMTIRKRIEGICKVTIETIRLPDEASGSAVAFVKLSSAENSQNVAELIREMKWGWNCTQCG